MIKMADETSFTRQLSVNDNVANISKEHLQKITSDKQPLSSVFRSSSLTSLKQHRHRDEQVFVDYRWILQTDNKRLAHQKLLEERQKAIINALSPYQTQVQVLIDHEIHFLPGEPVLVGTNTLFFDITNDTIDVNQLSFRLARLASQMLDKIKILCQETHLPFDKQFRLELRPATFYNSHHLLTNLWELRLNLDPVVWFDYHWQQNEKQADFLKIARAYVDKYRHFVPYEYLPDPPRHEPLAPERHCRYQATCDKEGGKYAHATHSTLICLEKGSMLRDDGLQKCGQFFINSTVAMQWPVKTIWNTHSDAVSNDINVDYGQNFHWQQSSFVFTNKRETVRDLVMHTTPPWHLTNRKMARLPLFWIMVIYTCRFLREELRLHTGRQDVQWPVETIALNFGKWETAGSHSIHAVDCHGHAHFLLTLEFINECDDTFFRPLQGRQNAPPDYLLQNVEVLERERLLSCEIRAHQQAMSGLKAQMDDVQANVNKILSALDKFLPPD